MLSNDGDWSILVGSPLAIGLWAIAVAGFVLPIIFGKNVKKRMEGEHSEEEIDDVISGDD